MWNAVDSRHSNYRGTKLRKLFLENDILPTNDTYNEFSKWKGPMSIKGSSAVEQIMESYIQEKRQEQETQMITVNVKHDNTMSFSVSYDTIRGIKSLIENLEDRYDEGKQILCRDFDEKTYDKDEFTEVQDGETIYVKNHSTNEKFRSRHINHNEDRYVYVYNFTVISEPVYLEYDTREKTFQLFSEVVSQSQTATDCVAILTKAKRTSLGEDETIGDETNSLTECLRSNTRNWSSETIFNVARLYQSHRYVY